MTAYIFRRLIQSAVVLIFLSFVTYGLMGLMPGDPLDIACAANPHCTPENLAQMKSQLGLDRPIQERYFKWAVSFLKGDLGYSRTYRQPVSEILFPRLVNTLVLEGLALLVSLIIAVPLGIFSSLKANTTWDYAINFSAFLGISAPSFWLGLIFMIFFSVKLGWFPPGGVETVGEAASMGFWSWILDRGRYLVLPVATLSCLTVASWVRYIRASMIEALRMDFVRTAKAKGLSQWQVVVKHAFRNALLPFVTVIALSLSGMFSGAVITETVFSYQGIGKLMYDSIIGNDFNVAMVSFLIGCIAVLVMNLCADIAYAYLDPRVSLK